MWCRYVQLAHFLGTPSEQWGAALCDRASDLNAAPTSPAHLCTCELCASARRGPAPLSAPMHSSAALPLLEQEGADIVDAVLRAHAILRQAQPLARKLACTPTVLHKYAARSCLERRGGLLGVRADATDVRLCRFLCERSAELPALQWLSLVSPQRAAISGDCAAAVDALIASAAAGGALQQLRFEDIACPQRPAFPGSLAKAATLTQLYLISCSLTSCSQLDECTMLQRLATLPTLQAVTCHAPGPELRDVSAGLDGFLDTLAKQPALERVQLANFPRLDVRTPLTRATRLRHLEAPLDTARDLAAVCAACSALTHLGLARSAAAIAGALHSVARLPRLVHLDLRDCALQGDTAVQALGDVLTARTGLVHLDLSGTRLGDAGCAMLAQHLQGMLHLRHLGTRMEGKSSSGSLDIGNAVARMTSLTSLHGTWPEADDSPEARQLLLRMNLQSAQGDTDEDTSVAVVNNLRHFDGIGTRAGVHRMGVCVTSMVRKMQNYALEFAEGQNEPPGADVGGEAFWEHFAGATTLTTLRLSRCGAEEILGVGAHLGAAGCLREALFPRNALGGAVAAVVSRLASVAATLTRLDLCDNQIGANDAAACCAPLAQLTGLRQLALGGNEMSTWAVRQVAAACGALTGLRHLGLAQSEEWGRVLDEDVVCLHCSVSGLAELTRLDLPPASVEGLQLDLHDLFPGVLVCM
jgi:Leucine Rich repeat